MTCQALAYLLTHLVLSNPKNAYTGVSNLGPAGCVQPRTAVSAAQQKIIHFLKT